MVKKDKAVVATGDDGKRKSGALAAARSVMEKVFPKEQSAEVRIDEARFTESHPHLPTGSVIIDHLIGGIPNKRGVLPCPGLPRGRLVNLYGAESSGKTTFALTVAAETCRRGGTVAYIDWEHAIDIAYAKNLGVPIDDPNAFVLYQPETFEKGLSYLWGLTKAGVDLVVVDSVAAGATEAQWEQSVAEASSIGRVGAKAAIWSEFLPKLKALMSKTNTCIIGISQLRSKIDTGGFGAKGGGEKTQQQGGFAWKFYSEVRMGLRKIMTEKGKRYDPITHTQIDAAVGNIVLAKIDKCKFQHPKVERPSSTSFLGRELMTFAP
jgi:recombination protein RecA